MNSLFETVSRFPQTEIWNDSCSCDELSRSIKDNLASGATTNPTIVLSVLKRELKDWEPKINSLIQNNPTADEDDVAWEIIKAMGTKASILLLPQFDSSGGQKGRISFQTNAKYYRNAEKMIEHAEYLALACPNSQVKVPASKAGIEAYEELTYRGISINATVSFTVAQAVAVAEAVERGLRRREAEGLSTIHMHPVCTIMAGRLDDYLKNYIKKSSMLVNPEILEWAGVATVKNAYQIYQKKQYRTKLLVAAFRNPYHWNQFIGGNVILTIPYSWQKKYQTFLFDIHKTIDDPVKQDYLVQLKKLTEFNKAYEPDGMVPEQFEHYGAFTVTMNGFLKGYDELVDIIRAYMVR